MHARKTLVGTVLGVASLACSCDSGQHSRRLDLPSIVLWAWERPENLRYVDPRTTGIAFLAGSAFIAKNGSVDFRPRLQPLVLPPGAAVLAVVRIESVPIHAPVQAAALLAGLRKAAGLPGVRGLQIDFDARVSERPFYRLLLASMQRQTQRPIGITALASWCEGDRWLESEPLAEAVPMFFRMGRGESNDGAVVSPVCRSAIGLSTDEPWPPRRSQEIKRIYLFSPRAWTHEEYTGALERIEKWK